MERCHFPSPVQHEGSIHDDFRWFHCACDARIISRRNDDFSVQIRGFQLHVRAQMRDDQHKLDKTRACSNRAGPRYLSGEDASVTLTSNHEGHATGQRNNASASGDRSGGTGVRQGRGSPALGAGRRRSVRVTDAATSGDGGRAVAGRDLAAGGHAGGANGAGGGVGTTLIGGGYRRIIGMGRRLSGATGVVASRGRGLGDGLETTWKRPGQLR